MSDAKMMTELADLLDGRLGPDARSRLAARLSGDDALQDGLTWLLGFRRAARAVSLEEPSPWVAQTLDQHFARWVKAQDLLGNRPERTRAVLSFDSRRESDLVGVRGAAVAEEISLAFACDAGELSVEALPDRDERLRLLGQVLLADDTDAPFFSVTAVCDGVQRRTSTDALGRFRFEQMAAAPTELRLGNGQLEIEARLELGPSNALGSPET